MIEKKLEVLRKALEMGAEVDVFFHRNRKGLDDETEAFTPEKAEEVFEALSSDVGISKVARYKHLKSEGSHDDYGSICSRDTDFNINIFHMLEEEEHEQSIRG